MADSAPDAETVSHENGHPAPLGTMDDWRAAAGYGPADPIAPGETTLATHPREHP